MGTATNVTICCKQGKCPWWQISLLYNLRLMLMYTLVGSTSLLCNLICSHTKIPKPPCPFLRYWEVTLTHKKINLSTSNRRYERGDIVCQVVAWLITSVFQFVAEIERNSTRMVHKFKVFTTCEITANLCLTDNLRQQNKSPYS